MAFSESVPATIGSVGSFSAEAWARNADRFESIRTMPFNTELAAGTLSRERFSRYIVQDAHYLIGFGRALAVTAAKAPHPDAIVQFARAAETAIVVERALHGGFFRDYGIGPDEFAGTPLSPACDHYVSWLLATAWSEPYEVVLGALLPCFWIYAEIGRGIVARAAPDNPYRAWIDTYSGEDFATEVAAMIAAADAAAQGASPVARARMQAAFTHATRHEYAFWDGAYRDARWPL